MRRSEKFKQLLDSVCEVTEIRKKEILSQSKLMDVCMARNLLFLLCHRGGLRPVTIRRLCQMEGWDSVGHSTVLKNNTRATKQEEVDDEVKHLKAQGHPKWRL